MQDNPIIVALIALSGVIVGIIAQPFVQTLGIYLSRATERAKLLREKREEIVLALLEHELWFEENSRNVDRLNSQATSLQRARVLQRLYFASGHDAMDRTTESLARFRSFMWDCQESGGLNYSSDAEDREYLELYQAHRAQINACIEVIASSTRREAGLIQHA